jgi:ParB/RepB/Spo0J family partition protein
VNRVIQPIVVTSHPKAQARRATPYMILVGERRWRAAQIAGLVTIPAIVREGAILPADRLLLQIAENEERAALSLLERARAYRRACELSRLSQNAFAKRCGKSRSFLSQIFRLTEAVGPLKDALEERLLTRLEWVTAFEQLPEEVQRRVVETARREGRPITQRRLQEALAAPAGEAPGAQPEPAPERPLAAARPAAPAPVRARRIRVPGSELLAVPLTFAQLKDLLTFLGARPLSTPAAAIDQLKKLVAGMAGATADKTRRPWVDAPRGG